MVPDGQSQNVFAADSVSDCGKAEMCVPDLWTRTLRTTVKMTAIFRRMIPTLHIYAFHQLYFFFFFLSNFDIQINACNATFDCLWIVCVDEYVWISG